jgi:dTDP-L-rhamnose 4-epimerase
MAKRVLITGGAGFIGIHLANKLHELGFQVTIYDNFSEQIHGQDNVRQSKIDWLASIYNVIVGDVLDRVSLTKAIQSLKFGSIEITVHDGKVTQIEKREKL